MVGLVVHGGITAQDAAGNAFKQTLLKAYLIK